MPYLNNFICRNDDENRLYYGISEWQPGSWAGHQWTKATKKSSWCAKMMHDCLLYERSVFFFGKVFDEVGASQ